MEDSTKAAVWIEDAQGGRTPVGTGCSFGRAHSNTVVLPGGNVSRRHATIHKQGEDEYWLADLGSANGTYVNGRRLVQPCRLADGDRIEISSHHFQFRQPAQARKSSEDVTTEQTLQDIRSVDCWLMVADIEASTQFARQSPADEAPRLTGRWLAHCKQIVEENQGVVNKFLGDGFFAYWRDREDVLAAVNGALEALRKLQAAEQPRFRIVVHYGRVFVGGGASLGEESLLGSEVNFVFRMEKVAAAAGHQRLISQPAQERIGHLLTCEADERRPVAGFDGDFLFYTF